MFLGRRTFALARPSVGSESPEGFVPSRKTERKQTLIADPERYSGNTIRGVTTSKGKRARGEGKRKEK